MLGYILLATIFVGGIVLLFLFLTPSSNDRELGDRFNNVAWNIAVYGTDEAFQEELKHWRRKKKWKNKLLDLRRRRVEIAEYWATKTPSPA